ncbi:MAG: FG-GAP repeat protein [Alphaproteobacteria bacterium]|nr:FG-GAP repeat protein [Alphaproteobacteria bacterium]
MCAALAALLVVGCGDKESQADEDGDGYTADVDCDDQDPAVNPGAAEGCDGVDNDCDLEVDEPGGVTGGVNLYPDADADGHGAGAAVSACPGTPGLVEAGDDCDDENPTVLPGADELCDGLDNDCDGAVDDDPVDAPTWYADLDGDGFGGSAVSETACEAPEGYAPDDSDCNDGNEGVFPGADEYCDGIDNDCDAVADEGGALDASEWWVDEDGDSYGGEGSTLACNQPSGYAPLDGDCDDTESGVNPGAVEVCRDGLDNDCDGTSNDCKLTGQHTTAEVDAVYHGIAESDYAGYAVALPGDLDGDGYQDVAIGAYNNDDYKRSAGAVYVVYGDGTAPTGEIALSDHPYIHGEHSSDYMGYSLHAGGDMDGDGLQELLIGAHNNDEGGANAGAAYLLYGGTPLSGDDAVDEVATKLVGEAAGDSAGRTVAPAGDVDGDGLDDILVGAKYGHLNLGVAYLIYGDTTRLGSKLNLSSADAAFEGDAVGDYVGDRFGLTGAGDLDGDGCGDFLVGAYGYDRSSRSNAGILGVFYGDAVRYSGDLPLTDADALYMGSTASDWFAHSTANAGDTNGDGYGDFLVSAHQPDSSLGLPGEAYLFLGSATRHSGQTAGVNAADATFQGEAALDYAGWSLAATDLDADGFADLAISAWGNSQVSYRSGAVYVIYGDGGVGGAYALGADEDLVLYGQTSTAYLGWSMAGGGDADDDGFEDLLVGSYGLNSYRGAALLFRGSGL